MLTIDEIKAKAQTWLGSEYNEETRNEVMEMLERMKRNL